MSAVYGRSNELATADEFVTSAATGSSVLLIEGEAGIGKTTVWRETVERARPAGIRVLSCRPAETEAKFALSALADLLGSVPDEALATLPEPQRRALEVALLRAQPGEGARFETRTLGTAVVSLLAKLDEESPVLVAVDDVQWLDPSSAAVVSFALRRVRSGRLSWLFSRRTGEVSRVEADELGSVASVSRLTLGPLTLGALHHMLRDRVPATLTRPALIRIHNASGGNPFYALEIASAVASGTPADSATQVPDDVRELVRKRVAGLPPDAREALLAAAALARPTAEVVERATSSAGLAVAEETGLVRSEEGRLTFAHPLYASAVYTIAATSRRRLVHERLAGLVDEPEEHARHLALAAAKPDEAVALALDQGGAHARSRGAWESAAELLELARNLTPPSGAERAHARALRAAADHIHAGDRRRARAMAEEILSQTVEREHKAEALRLCAEVAHNDENFDEAKRLYAEALEHADGGHAVRIEMSLSHVYGYDARDYAIAREHAYHALERAQAIHADAEVADALALCAVCDYLTGRRVDWSKVERAVAEQDHESELPLQLRPEMHAGMLAFFKGRFSQGRERLQAVRATATERGDESDVAYVLLWLSLLETRAGNLDEAAELAAEGTFLARLTGSNATYVWVLAQRAYAEAQRGDSDLTRNLCAEVEALLPSIGNGLIAIWVAAAHATLELSHDNPRAAWEACSLLVDAIERDPPALASPYFFLPDAMEALVALGELERAQGLIDLFEQRDSKRNHPWPLAAGARCRALVLAARGDLDGAATELDRGLAEHERLEMTIELARTLLVCGVIARRRRRRTEAKEYFERALDIFERSGARLWAERTKRELERLGLRRSSGADLTEGERRVAELAASGMTNREVAAALYVSPKTVEARLAHVYRKLAISSRAELGAQMTEYLQT
jgi:DNA-binding CsgD family transcriptional regulator